MAVTGSPSRGARRGSRHRLFELLVAAIGVGTIIGLVALWPGDVDAPWAEGLAADTERAEVTSVTYEACPPPQTGQCGEAEVGLETGPEAGDTVTLPVGGGTLEPELEPGDEIRVARTEPAPVEPPASGESPAPNRGEPEGPTAGTGLDLPAQGDPTYTLTDFERRAPILWLALGFAALVIAFGRLRGALSLLGLGISLAVILAFIVPAILDGSPPLVVAVIGSLAVMLATVSLAHGWGPKSLAAMLGTAVSLGLVAGLALAFTNLTHLTGLSSEEATLLLQGGADVSLEGLLLAGVVVAARRRPCAGVRPALRSGAARGARPRVGHGEHPRACLRRRLAARIADPQLGRDRADRRGQHRADRQGGGGHVGRLDRTDRRGARNDGARGAAGQRPSHGVAWIYTLIPMAPSPRRESGRVSGFARARPGAHAEGRPRRSTAGRSSPRSRRRRTGSRSRSRAGPRARSRSPGPSASWRSGDASFRGGPRLRPLPARARLDPVQESPVGAEGRLRGRDQRVGVRGPGALLDQLADLGRVTVVALLVDGEVLGPGAVLDPVERGQPMPLDARDLRLAALDRVQLGERGQEAVRRGPLPHALRGLGRGRGTGAAADGIDEAVPEPHVGGLLVGVVAQLGAVGSLGGSGRAHRGDSLDRVTVLARVSGGPVPAQLTGRPPLIERMLEDVPAAATLLDAVPDVAAHARSPRVVLLDGPVGREHTEPDRGSVCDPRPPCAPTPPTSPFPRCRRASGGSARRHPRSSASPRPARCSSTSSTSSS